MIFVLLGRDAAAPVAIRAWVQERIRIGKNKSTDAQIEEAIQCADDMEFDRSRGGLYSQTINGRLADAE